ncbi:unnamed protein product, partial [Didymodactylos carnosus]
MGGCCRSKLPPQMLPSNEIERLCSQTELSPEDIEKWYEYFIHCYPKGKLNKKQFISYYQKFREENKSTSKKIIQNLFRTFDLNNDKKIDFYEFVLANVVSINGSLYEKLKYAFNMYDLDKNKYLDRKEIEHVLRGMFDLLEIPNYDKDDLDKAINIIF